MKVMIPYGSDNLSVEIPEENLLDAAKMKDPPELGDVETAVRTAINVPIGTENLAKMVRPNGTVAIVINDITRPRTGVRILPPVLEELHKGGVKDKDITLIVATGMHRANTPEEQRLLLGGIVDRIRVMNHDAKDEKGLIYLGATRRGVPVKINRTFAESEFKVLTGLISPHQSAGYSGGRKSILPGIASYDTIRAHHSFPICPRAVVVGQIEGNLFHEEALEVAKRAGVDFIVNAVVNSEDRIVGIVAGDLQAAWLQGVECCRKMLEVKIPEYADITIASPGGYPRDLNFWQSQKAIATAELITRKGGIIILVAQCADGLGEEKLGWFKWLTEASSPRGVIQRFEREGYVDGSDKAYLFARALEDFKIVIINESLDGDLLRRMFFEKRGDIQKALDKALSEIGKKAKIVALPRACECLPTIPGCSDWE